MPLATFSNIGHKVNWCKFGQQVVPLASANWATKWHNLHLFKMWSSGGATCIVSKVGHQVTSLALPHCLELPYWHYQLVSGWYLHQLSFKKVSHWLTSGPKDRTPGLPGSDIYNSIDPPPWPIFSLAIFSKFSPNSQQKFITRKIYVWKLTGGSRDAYASKKHHNLWYMETKMKNYHAEWDLEI